MKHAVVVGLQFGDEGKGSFVDYLCETRDYRHVVRYNGGAQAAHRVVRQDGREHVFRMFGSGTLAGASTILSRFTLVDPLVIAAEADELALIGVDRPLDLLVVSAGALVTTPLHADANRRDEMKRGDGRHGSCGRGIGATRQLALEHPEMALQVGDLSNSLVTLVKLRFIEQHFKVPHGRWNLVDLTNAYFRFSHSVRFDQGGFLNATLRDEPVVFEGAQGVLLDESYGFPPYNTWTDTTSRNALQLLTDAGQTRSDATVYGLTRSYATRHGPGPFPTESVPLTEALPDEANDFNQWQREWRVGHLDMKLMHYALNATNGVDELVVSCLDRLDRDTVCLTYRDDNEPIVVDTLRGDTALLSRVKPSYTWERPVIDSLEAFTGLPVTVTSYGPTAADKKERQQAHAA